MSVFNHVIQLIITKLNSIAPNVTMNRVYGDDSDLYRNHPMVSINPVIATMAIETKAIATNIASLL